MDPRCFLRSTGRTGHRCRSNVECDYPDHSKACLACECEWAQGAAGFRGSCVKAFGIPLVFPDSKRILLAAGAHSGAAGRAGLRATSASRRHGLSNSLPGLGAGCSEPCSHGLAAGAPGCVRAGNDQIQRAGAVQRSREARRSTMQIAISPCITSPWTCRMLQPQWPTCHNAPCLPQSLLGARPVPRRGNSLNGLDKPCS